MRATRDTVDNMAIDDTVGDLGNGEVCHIVARRVQLRPCLSSSPSRNSIEQEKGCRPVDEYGEVAREISINSVVCAVVIGRGLRIQYAYRLLATLSVRQRVTESTGNGRCSMSGRP